MAIKILVPEINTARASITLAIRRKAKSPLLVVLAELTRLAEQGEVVDARSLHKHFFKKFNIKQSKFNKIIVELIKDEIISREENTIELCQELFEKTNTILITSKII